MWFLILFVVCTYICSMDVVFCKIDLCIHIHWQIPMGLGLNDPWVESHMWPQQTWGQRSSRGQWPLVQVFVKRSLYPKEFKKGESGLFLTPLLMLWGGGHIACHVWRWVIVPSDLARSFGTICAHYCSSVIYRAITNMRARFEFLWERQLTLNKIIILG